MSTRGFSVIEIVLYCTVLGALAAVAIPRFASQRTQLAVRNAVDEFRSTHALARAVAIREGRTSRLRIDVSQSRFWIEIDTTAAYTGALDTIGPIRDLSTERITISSSRSLLCFDARGLATPIKTCPPGDATLVFTLENEADTVQTTVLGKLLRR